MLHKDLAKRTILDKILKDRAYEIATDSNYYEYQRALVSMVYKFFEKNAGIRNKCKWATSHKIT